MIFFLTPYFVFLNVFYVCDLYIVWLFQSCKKTLYASRTRCTWTYKCKHTYIHINIYTFLVLLYYGEIKLTSCVFQCYGLTCLHPHHAFKPWHANPLQKGQESPTSAIFYCSRQTLAPSIRLTMDCICHEAEGNKNHYRTQVWSLHLVNVQLFTMLTVWALIHEHPRTQSNAVFKCCCFLKRALDHLHASLPL